MNTSDARAPWRRKSDILVITVNRWNKFYSMEHRGYVTRQEIKHIISTGRPIQVLTIDDRQDVTAGIFPNADKRADDQPSFSLDPPVGAGADTTVL